MPQRGLNTSHWALDLEDPSWVVSFALACVSEGLSSTMAVSAAVERIQGVAAVSAGPVCPSPCS